MMPISGTASLMARTARQTRLPGLSASLASSSRSEGSVLGKSAMAGSPSEAASSAALTARSIDSRSTPGMAAIGVRARVPSMRKIGQIRSSVVSEVSRTSRRDQSARRLRLSRVAGKPGRVGACALLPARFARSVRNETALSLEDDTCVLPCSLAESAGKLPPALPRCQILSPDMVCHFGKPIRRRPSAAAPSCRDGNGSCGRRWLPAPAPCRKCCRHRHAPS